MAENKVRLANGQLWTAQQFTRFESWLVWVTRGGREMEERGNVRGIVSDNPMPKWPFPPIWGPG